MSSHESPTQHDRGDIPPAHCSCSGKACSLLRSVAPHSVRDAELSRMRVITPRERVHAVLVGFCAKAWLSSPPGIEILVSHASLSDSSPRASGVCLFSAPNSGVNAAAVLVDQQKLPVASLHFGSRTYGAGPLSKTNVRLMGRPPPPGPQQPSLFVNPATLAQRESADVHEHNADQDRAVAPLCD